MSKINIWNNIGKGVSYGLGLSIVGISSDVLLREIDARDNKNLDIKSYGVIYVVDKSSCINCRIQILNSIFKNNSAGSGSAISCNINILDIKNVDFISNTAISGDGGSLYLNTKGQGQYSISILSCIFSYDQVISGKGGEISINSQNTVALLFLQISKSEFLSNTSFKDASILYISNSVKFTTNSMISNCLFSQNLSYDKGNIYLQYIQAFSPFKIAYL